MYSATFEEIVEAARGGLVTVPELLGFQENDGDKVLRGAQALLVRGSTQVATDLLDWLVSAKPYVARYWLAYGVALQQQDRLGDAIRAYTVCLALDADNIVATVNRGECCLLLGAVERGLDDLECAVAREDAGVDLAVWVERARDFLAIHRAATEPQNAEE